MAITFPRVPEVAPGDPITSTQLRKLAGALNARLRSGLGDGPRRLIWYLLSQFRQIRNPDSSGMLFPSQAEFFEVYQHVDPQENIWPIAGAGEPEGANLASVMPDFVFGSEGENLDAEDIRLTDPTAGGIPMDIGGGPPTTKRQKWELAKWQRGAVDPGTGTLASPSFSAARSHFAIIRSIFGPHGLSYGGFLPTPVLLDPPDCGDGTTDQPPTPNYEIKFTSLVSGVADKVYPGTCPGTAGHVAGIASTPFEYVVVTYDGGGEPTIFERLPINEWLEGPYSGPGVLRRRPAQWLQRALNYFAAQFRGTPNQRASGGWNRYSFGFQRFMESQYILAPARAVNEGGGSLSPVYPAFELYGASTFSVGTRFYGRPGGARVHTVQAGCVIASLYVGGQKLDPGAGSVTIQILAGDAVVAAVTLSPSEEGSADDLIVLDTPIPAGTIVSVRLDTAARFSEVSSQAGLVVEFAELLDYKPQIHDLYTVLRVGGCRIDPNGGVDGSGLTETEALAIGISLFRDGVLVNVHGNPALPGSEAEINTNAVFDAARRFSKCVRILRRDHLIGYAVEDGKSVLWFRRSALGLGSGGSVDSTAPPPELEVFSGDLVLGHDYFVVANPGDYITHDGIDYETGRMFRAVATTFTVTGTAAVYAATRRIPGSGISSNLDAFDGIGPWRQPLNQADLQSGRRYIVRGDAAAGAYVHYQGHNYAPGQTFTAVGRTDVFLPYQGATVYEVDGIYHSATEKGFTNEWLFGMDAKVYRPEETSTWKPSAYTDWVAFSDRCHFYQSPTAQTLHPDARRHFAYGSRIWTNPESVPGYRYSFGLNQKLCDDEDTDCKDARRRFYKSCRIYEPFVEVDKAEVVFEGGMEVVKVTLTGRLHHHEDAPGSIDRDISTWNRSALHAEDYRTDENAIREYLVHQVYGEQCAGGENDAAFQPGNSGIKTGIWDSPQPPFGACFPTLYFVQLIPAPFEDSNDTPDAHDSPFLHDQLLHAELVVRAICEGWVDGKTSEDYGCTTGLYSLYDYTFESLCLEAFGGRWFGTLPSVATGYIQATHIRADKPQGFGPLPTTFASSEIWNQYARTINLLTKVRIALPYRFQTRRWRGSNSIPVTNVFDSQEAPQDCPGPTGIPGVVWSGTGPDAGADTLDADWFDNTFASSAVDCAFSVTGGPPPQFACSGVAWLLQTIRVEDDYRITLADPDAQYAMPETWRDMFETDGGILAIRNEVLTTSTYSKGDSSAGTTCGSGTGAYYPDGLGNYLVFSNTEVTTFDNRCEVVKSGRLHTPAVWAGIVRGCFRAAIDNTAQSGGPGNSLTLSPVDAATAFIQVPLD